MEDTILNILGNKLFKKISFTIGFLLSFFLDLLCFGQPFNTPLGKKNIWSYANISVEYPGAIASLVLIFLLILNFVCLAYSVISLLTKKGIKAYFGCLSTICFPLLAIAIGTYFHIINVTSIVLFILSLLIGITLTIYYIFLYRKHKLEKIDSDQKVSIFILIICAFVMPFIYFFIPAISFYNDSTSLPISVLTGNKNIFNFITFLVLFINLISAILLIIKIIMNTQNKNIRILLKHAIYYSFGFSVFYFLAGIITVFTFNILKNDNILFTISYIPLVLNTIILVAFSLCFKEEIKNKEVKKPNLRIESLIYTILFSTLPFICFVLNLITVKYDGQVLISLNGYQIVKDYLKLGTEYRLQAFMIMASLCVDIFILICFLVAFLSRNKAYIKLSIASVLVNSFIIIIFALFSKYYEIVQAMNMEMLEDLLGAYNQFLPDLEKAKVSSQTFYMTLVLLVLLIIVIIRNPWSDKENTGIQEGAKLFDSNDNIDKEIDPCQAFTELDQKVDSFINDLNERKKMEFRDVNLVSLNEYIVHYAKNSRLHLSYSYEDIATFIAGLGATRLTILQGMSGTGKTSLPKIFTEAIMGNCEIVEVESSWRDKNELLGYYNEFSKSYSPKKFTQALYKAKLNKDIITFIVLDEMNLSRIEYYFSDFLSLMENEEDKRELKLLNVPLYNYKNGKKIAYTGLKDGHTIEIPKNIYFIGTANRDESTFEISDKVYDRANTMNFNKRAPKVTQYDSPLSPQYVSYDKLAYLLNEAKSNFEFDIESSVTVKEVEKILSIYNISFGNRIAKQVEDFVKVYCSCFSDGNERIEEALEKILLSKVVSKLENKSVENKDVLIAEFKQLKMFRCAEFISKLNED